MSARRVTLQCSLLGLSMLAGMPNGRAADPPAEPIEVPARPSERVLEPPGFLGDQPPGGFVLPPVPQPAPAAPLAGPAVRVDAIVFEGNRAIPTAELQALAQPFLGRALNADEIEELRRLVTRHYVGKGYINSGALVAEDAYKSGTLTLRIVEGRLAEVRLTGQERLRESYIVNRLTRADEPLNVGLLQERFQLLLTDPLFAKMNAQLLPGAQPGEAILDVEVTRARPYQLTLFANNYRPPSIGEESYGATGWVRNLTGLGDALSGTFAYGRGGPSYSAAWSIPFGPYGSAFQASYEAGNTALIEQTLRDLDIQSEFTSLGLTLTQPLIDTLRQRLALGLTWADRTSSSKLLGQPFAFVAGEPEGGTEVRVWRFFQDYLQRWERSVLALRSTFSSGNSNIVESPIAGLTPSRDFFVWLGQFQYAHRVMDNGAQVLLRGVGQVTSDRLVPLEQIAIGGVGTVRGYLENQLVRDTGYAGSLEFHYPAWAAGAGGSLTLIGFVDTGAARNVDQPGQSLTSIGIGLTGRYKGLYGEIYLAHRSRNLAGDQGSSLQDKGISVQVSYDIF